MYFRNIKWQLDNKRAVRVEDTRNWLKFNHPDNTAVKSFDIWAPSFTGTTLSEMRTSTWPTPTCYSGGWFHSQVTKTRILIKLVSLFAPTSFKSGHSFGKMWLWISTFILVTCWTCGGSASSAVAVLVWLSQVAGRWVDPGNAGHLLTGVDQSLVGWIKKTNTHTHTENRKNEIESSKLKQMFTSSIKKSLCGGI